MLVDAAGRFGAALTRVPEDRARPLRDGQVQPFVWDLKARGRPYRA
jgi:hypothetical protein